MTGKEEWNKTIQDISDAVNILAVTADESTRNQIYWFLKHRVNDLTILNNQDGGMDTAAVPSQAGRYFTKEELAGYNGKNGMPAYVSVNGTVYDVTGNAAWGAATHFGLSAGNDLTALYTSCHAGQPVLQRLPVVGKMIE